MERLDYSGDYSEYLSRIVVLHEPFPQGSLWSPRHRAVLPRATPARWDVRLPNHGCAGWRRVSPIELHCHHHSTALPCRTCVTHRSCSYTAMRRGGRENRQSTDTLSGGFSVGRKNGSPLSDREPIVQALALLFCELNYIEWYTSLGLSYDL